MPKRRHKQSDGDDHEQANALTPHKILSHITQSIEGNQHWTPSKVLAKCLGVPYHRLFVHQQKDDESNSIWTTVVVLAYCSIRLMDFHEVWYELAHSSVAWLFQQLYFIENREIVVQMASDLIQAPTQAAALLTTLFAPPKDEELLALEASLENTPWQICYLQEPPYTMYFWNAETNQTTWKNPIEAAKERQEALEKKRQRDEVLAKVLPQRIRINRDRKLPLEHVYCEPCKSSKNLKTDAQILCLACRPVMLQADQMTKTMGTFFCEACCDLAHTDRTTVSHVVTSFRFRDCCGIFGFPDKKQILEDRLRLRLQPPITS